MEHPQVSRLRRVVALALILAGALSAGLAGATDLTGRRTGREALDWAFRFASAIESDPKDRARAQQTVVMDYASVGMLEEAAGLTESIEGWRRGVVYADLAGLHARSGQVATARDLIGKAEAVRATVPGWQNPRVAAHVADALAKMGELEQSRRIVEALASEDGQYAGRSAATIASAHGARREFRGAMEVLGRLDGESDLGVTWWRTAGYLDLAKLPAATGTQRRSALQAARRSAGGIPGWKRVEVLDDIAGALAASGDLEGARHVLRAGEGMLASVPATTPARTVLLSRLGRSWGSLGSVTRAGSLLERAEAAVPPTLPTERAGLYASIASSHRALGNLREAARLEDKAFAAAESLANARPRALASVDICGAMGREGVALDEPTGARLARLFEGLRDPW